MENKNQEIDLWALLKVVLKNWKIVVITAAIITVIGIVFVFTTPRQYNSTALLAPEQLEKTNEKDQPQEALYPQIYPQIVSSTDFLLQLFPLEVTNADGSLTTTYKEYMIRHQKRSFKQWAFRWYYVMRYRLSPSAPTVVPSVAKQGPVQLSRSDEELLEGLRARILCKWDKKTNVITLTVTDQDPNIAAIVANQVTNQLQEAITDYRTRKARLDVEYAQNIYDQAHQEYTQAQSDYATYCDAFGQATLESYKARKNELEQTMQLKFNAFSSANEHLQEAQAKLQENTPAFYIFQQASIAGKPCNGSRAKKVCVWLLMGLILGAGIALGKEYIRPKK